MLLNLHKKSWDYGLTLRDFAEHTHHNETVVADMLSLAKAYKKVCLINVDHSLAVHSLIHSFLLVSVPPQSLDEDETLTAEQRAIKHVGKQNPKRHLEDKVSVLLSANIVQCLGAMVNTVVFQ